MKTKKEGELEDAFALIRGRGVLDFSQYLPGLGPAWYLEFLSTEGAEQELDAIQRQSGGIVNVNLSFRMGYRDLPVKQIPRLFLKASLWPSLTSFSCCGHALEEIPLAFTQLPSLRVLHLGRNSIRYVTRQVAQMCALEELHLSCNQIAYMPFFALRECKNLRTLKLEDNPRLGSFCNDRHCDDNLAQLIKMGEQVFSGHEAALQLWMGARLSRTHSILKTLPRDVIVLLMGWCRLTSMRVMCASEKNGCCNDARLICQKCKEKYFCSKVCMESHASLCKGELSRVGYYSRPYEYTY